MGASPSRGKSVRQWCCENERAALLAQELENGVDEDGEGVQYHSIVQFSTAEYFATEDEGCANIDIVRFGDCSNAAQVNYSTADGSAKAGSDYQHAEGVLHFQPEELLRTISVPISKDDFWESTLEFKVVLTRPRQTRLGNHLYICTVHVIDDDSFPTNKYSKDVRDMDSILEVSGVGLLLEYIKLCMAQKAVRQATFKYLFMEQVKSLYFVLTLYLQVYLVDTVLRNLPPEERVGPMSQLIVPHRETTAIIVALMYVFPFGLVHLVDQWKLALGIPGLGRKFLQANLLRKFLNYPEEIRNSVSAGEIVMGMTRDVGQVVKMYMKVLAFLGGLGKASLTLGFILNRNKMASIPLSIFPLILGLFLLGRSKRLDTATRNMLDAQDDLVATVNDAVTNYRLIADFKLDAYTVAYYEDTIVRYNKTAKELGVIMQNTAFMPPWLMTILTGIYMVYGVFQVRSLGGWISLGTYLATMNAFKDMGGQVGEMFMELAQVVQLMGALKRLTFYLNQPTDLIRRMEVNRARLKLGRDVYTGRTGNSVGVDSKGHAIWGVDTVPLKLSQVKFSFCNANGQRQEVLRSINKSFPQGRLYGFIGDKHCGKATLLKLLGQVLVPAADCQVFVPPHLRILHVSRDVKIMNQSFLKNLIFDQPMDKIGGIERVRRVCEVAGFQPKVLAALEEDEDTHIQGVAQQSWVDHLSMTDYARLNLARALLMNPECLVMQMPLQAFGATEGLRLMSVLHKHVRDRGLGFPSHSQKDRRVRTAFVSISHGDLCCEADNVFEVSSTRGLVPVSFDRNILK